MSNNCSTCSSRGTCDQEGDSDSCTTGTCSGGVRLPPGITSIYNLDHAVERGTLIWAEVDQSQSEPRLSEAVLELVNKAKSLWDERIFAVLMGPAEYRSMADVLFQHGVDSVYHVRGREAAFFDAVAYAEALKEVIERVKPAAILLATSARAQELAPRLAASIPCGLATDCIDIQAEGRHLKMIRPAYGGRVLAVIESDLLPQMATIRPGAFQKGIPEISRKGTVINWPAKSSGIQELMVSIKNEMPSNEDISKAKVLVSIGAGLCEAEDVQQAHKLAGLLGGMVSCSRTVADKKILPAWKQVGHNGRSVHPRVYIAFGISGTLQHQIGISDSQIIIAVNKDPEAPIHDVADLSVIADGREVMQSMIDLLLEQGR